MSKLKPYRFKTLIRKLRKYDPRFEVNVRKGKGSHKIIYHPSINGRVESYPIKCHGANPEITVPYIKQIINHFDIPDGVL